MHLRSDTRLWQRPKGILWENALAEWQNRKWHRRPAQRHLTIWPERHPIAADVAYTFSSVSCVDMMETDVHMTADGYLVMIHDDTVERTTDGHGVISTMTLAEIKKLRLRQNLGGYAEPLTDEHVPTLDEMLKAAKGRITLNLDVKAPIYAEVVDAVQRAGVADLVTVKTRAGITSPALAAIAPFNKMRWLPVLNAKGSDLVAVAERQATDARPVAFELPNMLLADVPKIVAVERQYGIKLFSNTLGDGFCIGGDNDALKDPDAVWGWLYRNGISIFQTDRPEALLEFRSSQHK